MVKPRTPDTVPSLAALSTEEDDDNISRTLFRMDSREEDLVSDNKNARTPVQLLFEDKNSETPDHTSNGLCHVNLAGRDLSDLFTLFQGAQAGWPPLNPNQKGASTVSPLKSPPPPPSPVVSVADSAAVTTVMSNTIGSQNPNPWERQIDSLEHECHTLKEIIKTDAINILKLKSMVQAKLDDTSTRQLRAEVHGLRKERDVLKRQESAQTERLRKLQEQVDDLAAELHNNTETEQLRLENEMLVAQVIKYEEDMKVMMTQHQAAQKQEAQRERLVEETQQRRLLSTPEENFGFLSPPEPPSPLELKIDSLITRLETLEQSRHYPASVTPRSPDAVEVSVGGTVIGDKISRRMTSKQKQSRRVGLFCCRASSASDVSTV